MFSYITAFCAAAVCWLLLLPTFRTSAADGSNYIHITLNGTEIGALASEEQVQDCLREARRNLSGDGESMLLAESELSLTKDRVAIGRIDSTETIIENMTEALRAGQKSTLSHSFTVKINEYAVNLSSMSDVYELLYASKRQIDTEDEYDVSLALDGSREINVLTASIITKEAVRQEREMGKGLLLSGADRYMAEALKQAEPSPDELDFSAFHLGLTDLSLGDKVEIVESYLPAEEITPVGDAISEVTKDTETNKIYEVVAGDTTGEIAMRYDLTLEQLIAMNEILENENSTIRVGDQLTVTVPEPLLSVNYTMEEYVEEDFTLPTEYVYNDNWYQDESAVLREGVTGHRRIIALTGYVDGAATEREIVKEEVTQEAVAQIIERGTKVRPIYIKPISGGMISSRFGYRVLRGRAGTHSGIDWACPMGTSIFASCGGRVTYAGWMGSYGYVVFIDHPDGRQTRYAHMSRVLCSVGQYVNQLDRIGLSGSTGNSTGPHLHFEVRIGGQAVDPLGVIQ
ncbi:MAG: peptidoglycan DD-metalloendopeptidase family protein [Lachnospiraceae bacterium]|nr:peptidoglycan DD-metalloendopeptidase family protein [Lachnospiraceae bacterium]